MVNPPALPHGAVPFDKIEAKHFMPALDWAIGQAEAKIQAIKDNPDAPSFENSVVALMQAVEEIHHLSLYMENFSLSYKTKDLKAVEGDFTSKASSYLSENVFGNKITLDEELFARIKEVYDNSANLSLGTEDTTLLNHVFKCFERGGANLTNDADKDRIKEIDERMAKLTTQFSDNSLEAAGSYQKIIEDVADLDGVPQRVVDMYANAAQKLVDAATEEVEKLSEKLEIAKEIGKGTLESLKGTLDSTAYADVEKAIDEQIEKTEIALEKAELKASEVKEEYEGKYLIQSSTAMSVLTHATNRDLRKEIQGDLAKLATQEPNDNRPVIMEIVALRHERAQLLGYENHAEFILSDRMAGDPETVLDFLEKNRQAYKPKAEAEYQQIKDFALQKDGITDMKPWDSSYYGRLLEEETFDFDAEEMRKYFEMGNVLNGLFDHAEKLFGVKMVEAGDKYPVANEDVKAYEVVDATTGEIKGLFYADMYARPGQKKSGAWMSLFRDRGTYSDGQDQIPVVMNNLNIPKPEAGKPTLLSIDEVETIFHEFGHGLHGLMAEGKHYFLTGPNVKWDFVELPSQVQENWATEQEVLETYATHYETGEVLPAEYVQKLEDMSTFSSGMMGLRQTSLALIDMTWHTTDPADLDDFYTVEKEVAKTASLTPFSGNTMSQRFGHLFSDFVGYSSGYYSYKWAEVLDADVFEAFKEAGLYDEELSARLLETIYAKGGTEAPDEIYRQMMGRDPDPKALFRREGIIEEDSQSSAPAQDRSRGGPGMPKP